MIYYAEKRGDKFHHIFGSEAQVRLCTRSEPVEVKVIPDENGDYWGWQNGDGISMIHDDFRALKICFPYGIDAAEKAGQGKRIRLRIEEIKEVIE